MASVVDLTTVAQPVQEQGAVAARLLLDTLDGPGDGPDRGGPAHPARRARQHRHALVPAVLVGPGLTPPHSAARQDEGSQNRPVVAIAAPTMPALFCSTAGTTGVPTLT